MFGEMDKKVKTRRMNLSDCVFRAEVLRAPFANKGEEDENRQKNESRQAAAELDLKQ